MSSFIKEIKTKERPKDMYVNARRSVVSDLMESVCNKVKVAYDVISTGDMVKKHNKMVDEIKEKKWIEALVGSVRFHEDWILIISRCARPKGVKCVIVYISFLLCLEL